MAGLLINGTEYELDPNKLSVGDACSVEDFYGAPFGKWAKDVSEGSIKALKAFVTVLARKADPTLRSTDIDKLDLSALMGLGQKGAEEGDSGEERGPLNPTMAA